MRHLTDTEIDRRITTLFELRCQIHDRMMGPAGDPMHPAVSPLSQEWADLAAEYDALAAESSAMYTELHRREAIHA